jgi:hypothetical protein
MGEMRNAYKVLARKLEEEIPLRVPRPRWEDNIKMCIGEIGCDDAEYCEHDKELSICTKVGTTNVTRNIRFNCVSFLY